jgi:hypothetical protein
LISSDPQLLTISLGPVVRLLGPAVCLLGPVVCLLGPVVCLLGPVVCLLGPVVCLLGPAVCLPGHAICLLGLVRRPLTRRKNTSLQGVTLPAPALLLLERRLQLREHLEEVSHQAERCGGRLRPVALVRDLAEAERYLRQRGEFTAIPGPARSRGPPAAAA